MLDWVTIITIISAVGGVAGVVFAIFVGLRSKQIFRPVLTFNTGLSCIDPHVQKTIKKAPVSTLIFGASIPRDSEVAFICPYLMANNSKLPIFNVTLQLQYAARYVIKNEEKIIGIIDRGAEYEMHVLGSPPKWFEHREVQIIGPVAQVFYTIPVLRPGEAIIITDVVKFVALNHSDEIKSEDYGVNQNLAKKLRKIRKLCDFCVIDVFIYSESCPPLSNRIKLLWFDTDSEEELVSLFNDAVKTFWGGKWPKPGLYFGPWPLAHKKLVVEEYGEAIIPKLKRIKVSKGRYFYWEDPLECEGKIVSFGMPPWNYYQLPDNLDIDELISRFGWRKVISREKIEKLHNIFKSLRKRGVGNSAS